MKKKLALLLLCGITATTMAQNQEEKKSKNIQTAKHELRLDAIEALAVPALDISYEYVLSQYSGLGVTAWVGFDSDDDGFDSSQQFAITPYFRQYFFNKKEYGARGFYAEGLLQFATGEERGIYVEGDFQENLTENWTNFGIGFALGQKWVSNNGFVLDLSIGAGRYLGSNDIGPEAFFRGGIGVGYRF